MVELPVLGAHPVPGDSLGSGAAGIALLPFEQARLETAPQAAAHRWATTMTRGPVTAHPDHACLYRDAPAVAFALHTADHPAYAAALDTLDEHIATVTRHRLSRCSHTIP
ncbi:glycoside hydrolase family protein [Actinokineospora iranica]|uniref:Uncharacterized protein n=1 Tax=Actinokineospora iranica TaxID=1271860 RepID=A0A1G6VQA6_9PSEU|nr:hypothetical protein [Actinokineospora iranica]SDD55016.1 hypothetical protein SAMN05216174_1136 [Actinokineospora iranica]